MVKTKVLELLQHAINQKLRLLNEPIKTEPVKTLLNLYTEVSTLCNNFLDNQISVKYFNDHLKIINLGLESNIYMLFMENRNIIVEE